MKQSPGTRRRLTPEHRRTLLLDVAAHIVSVEGASAATLERIGAEAGVSKALAYSYFSNRTTLLAALLLREYPAFTGTEAYPVDETRTFEEIVRDTTGSYIRHVVEKGVLLQRLMAEPRVVASVAEHHSQGREATARFFGAQMASDHGVPADRAFRAADILMGVTGAAGRIVDAQGTDVEEMTHLVTRIIMAAVRGISPDVMSPADAAPLDE